MSLWREVAACVLLVIAVRALGLAWAIWTDRIIVYASPTTRSVMFDRKTSEWVSRPKIIVEERF